MINTLLNKNVHFVDIKFGGHSGPVSGITFIKYAQHRKIGN